MSIGHVSLNDTSEYRGELLHILMPSRGTVAIETMLAFGSFGWSKAHYEELSVAAITMSCTMRSPVAPSRDALLTLLQRKMAPYPNCRHWALWVDDDAIPQLADILALLSEMRLNEDIGILSCWYCPKLPNHPGWIPSFGGEDGRQNTKDLKLPGRDFTIGSIVEVPWIGMHCALMRGELVNRLKRPAFVSNASGVCEDIYFSNRIRELKRPDDTLYKCAVHTGVRVPHVDTQTGTQYLPSMGANRE